MNNLLGRLNDVFEEVAAGVPPVNAECKAAVVKVAAWLGGGSTNPLIPLSAMQVLLANGEVRSRAIVGVMKPLREVLQEEWGAVAPHEHKLLALKCLLLAAWDKDQMYRGGYRAFGLAGSAWRTIPSRPPNGAGRIEALLNACSAPLQKERAQSKRSPIGAQATGNFTTAKEALSKAQTEASTNPPAAAIASLVNASQAVINANLNVEEELRGHLRSLDVREHMDQMAATSELLWWSHARYGYHRGVPLRQLPSTASKQWWAAFELAERTDPLDAEPAASLLVETLRDLGLDPSEKRPLHAWLIQLHETLQNEPELPLLSEGLAAHVEECAIGLPITWLRGCALSRDALDLATLTEVTQLRLDTEISSWQWSSWLLRECLLEQMVR